MANKLGNRIRTFDTEQDLWESGYKGNVTVRYKEAGSPFCQYNVPWGRVSDWLARFVTIGAKRELFTFNESAPDQYMLTQGEFMHGTDGYCLYTSEEPLPMRKALANSGRQYYRLQALGRLKAFCNPTSYDMILDLLDQYPDHVIEFSAYSRNVGLMPHHNTLIWEIRLY